VIAFQDAVCIDRFLKTGLRPEAAYFHCPIAIQLASVAASVFRHNPLIDG